MSVYNQVVVNSSLPTGQHPALTGNHADWNFGGADGVVVAGL